jgi:hypothetical protein
MLSELFSVLVNNTYEPYGKISDQIWKSGKSPRDTASKRAGGFDTQNK